MEKIKIITDSGCDLDPGFLEELDIEMLPFVTELDGVSYYDRIDISPREYFKILSNSKSRAFTSQVTPPRFEVVFKKYLDKGYQIIYIGMSSKMTATYSAAEIAKKSLNDDKNLHLIDSLGGSVGLGYIASVAAKMVKAGKCLEEILEKVQNIVGRMEYFFSVGDLNRLRLSGRLSKGAAIIADVLNIKPVLKLNEGSVVVSSKVKGDKGIIKCMLKELADFGDNISEQVIPLTFADDKGYTLCMELKKLIEEKFGVKEFLISEVGMSIGSHVGSGALGLFFLKK